MSQKIAINQEVGSFNMSLPAQKMLLELKGLDPHFYHQRSKTSLAEVEHDIWEVIFIEVDENSQLPCIYTTTIDYGETAPEIGNFFRQDLIPRDDKDLITVIEKFGVKANGEFCDLKVVEIPDGVNWEIVEEYGDGEEYIGEKRRTWR